MSYWKSVQKVLHKFCSKFSYGKMLQLIYTGQEFDVDLWSSHCKHASNLVVVKIMISNEKYWWWKHFHTGLKFYVFCGKSEGVITLIALMTKYLKSNHFCFEL